ncbi:MAG TPA: alpha/beta-type small acid-soluble spore protein [Cerasibacillus sp.]|uniref:alpha/beta-type small acid-soluble spore protein n=1 Tax=Cerasibacillus sp. TaxID=2498711 RepID=UPI002F3E7C5A
MARRNNNNQLLVPGAEDAVNNMKEEIANEMDVELGADTTARENGKVGGEMVKRMIRIAEETMAQRRGRS